MRTLTIALLIGSMTLAQDGAPEAFRQAPLVRDGQYVLWHDPGPVESLDFRYGIGDETLEPKPPFTFEEEDPNGSTPKITVKDANDRRWTIKFGPEASPDTFCTRMAWAMGYYTAPTYFVEEGSIEGVKALQRARGQIASDGRFRAGRFQLRSKQPKFLKTVTWSWEDNPFLKTPELAGLKILMMLLSDWDNKDARDAESRGTNTGIYQYGGRLYYFIDDWGGAMGSWGKYFTRSKWNAGHFLAQSDKFVRVNGDALEWGYVGQHSQLLKEGIGKEDIRWLLERLAKVSDEQLRAGLTSSGATPEQCEKYVRALRLRIEALAKASV